MARTAVTERRIAHIADKMRRLEWQRGKSGPIVAKRWRLSRSTVEKLAAEAGRRVRAEIVDPEAVTLTITAALDRTLRDALADGDRRTVVRVADVWARIAGATASNSRPAVEASAQPSLMIFYPAEDSDDEA